MNHDLYSSPDNSLGPPQEYLAYEADDGFVRQIPIVGILNVVQGSLEVLMAIGLTALTVVLSNVSSIAPENMDRPTVAPPSMIIAMQALIAGAVLLISVMRIVGGVCVLRRRNRVLAIVASAAGIATSITCYCAPSSIVLAIYSLIVLLQPTVIAVFERR